MRENLPIEVKFFRRVVEDADPYMGYPKYDKRRRIAPPSLLALCRLSVGL